MSRAFEDWLNVSWVLIPIIGFILWLVGGLATIVYFGIKATKAFIQKKK